MDKSMVTCFLTHGVECLIHTVTLYERVFPQSTRMSTGLEVYTNHRAIFFKYHGAPWRPRLQYGQSSTPIFCCPADF